MMMLAAMMLPILICIGFFLYFFFRRSLLWFGLDVTKPKCKWILIAVSVLLASAGFSTTILIIYMYWMGVSLCVACLHLILKKIIGKKGGYRKWENLYRSGLLVVGLTAAVVLSGVVNLYTVRQTQYTVSTDKEITAAGYRVALIADVHFGISLSEKALQEKCDEIEKQDPDMVILCGDIVDYATDKAQMYQVFAALGDIESKYGTFYVYGNHDRNTGGMENAFSPEELKEAILSNGITILQDEVLQLTEDLVIVGREDRSRRDRDTLQMLLQDVDRDDFLLVLDHQPNEYGENEKQGTDLLLSGHTHGGQLFPIDYLQEWIPFNDGVYGLYEWQEGRCAIITSGFGTWGIPFKTAGRAEYVIIDIVNK